MRETEWFSGREIDEQMERCYWRRAGFVVVLAAIAAALLFPLMAYADPIFQAQTPEGVVITLHTDKCTLKEVENLPTRITWDEKGKVTEGCYGVKYGIVIFYFADKTAGIIPAQAFEKVIGV